MYTTSDSLLQRLRDPAERAAWDRFVELYTPLLFYWARREGLQQSDAADLVQDVFTALLQKLPDFVYDRTKSFRTWLRTVTLNKLRDWRRRQPSASGADGCEDLAELPDPNNLEAFWESDYRAQLVARAMEIMQTEFEPSTWKACWEVVVAGRRPANVAAEFGMTLDAVYAAKSRVLRRLRQDLDGLLD